VRYPTVVGGHTGVMTREEVLAICLNLPAAEETYPFGEEVAVFKVCGKMLALVPLSEEPGSVNLKSDPAQALELRAAYPGSDPGITRTSGTGTPWISTARSRTTSCVA
jgi:predicted DNA-binding protein (MmcQ/YjbR family)